MGKLKPCPICGGDALGQRDSGNVECVDRACPLYDAPLTLEAWQALPRAVEVKGSVISDDGYEDGVAEAFFSVDGRNCYINVYHDKSTARRGIKRFCKRNGLKLTKIEVA